MVDQYKRNSANETRKAKKKCQFIGSKEKYNKF